MEYHYQQAIQLLSSLNPKIDDLLDAYGDISAEYAHVLTMGKFGLREDVGPELDRLRTVRESLKFKIKHFKD